MARLQLIFPLLFWVLWLGTKDEAAAPLLSPGLGTCVYLGGLVGVVLLVAFQSAWAMRKTSLDRTTPVPRFHRTVFFARWFTLGWHATALWSLGFGDFVLQTVPTYHGHFKSAAAFSSILPVIGAWVGLLAAQYPLERGVREQNAMYAIEFGEPVRPVPTRLAYLMHAVRSQILFTLVPLFCIAVTRDSLAMALRALGFEATQAETVSTLTAAVVVFVLAPEIIRRVLPTRSLPDSPARERLEAFAKSRNLGVRDILLWDTHHGMGNAAVMGVVPGIRYVMITDLLLETMPAEELEAVFAHEAGHVVHRHIVWYVVFWLSMSQVLDSISNPAIGWLMRQFGTGSGVAESVISVAGIAVLLLAFGMLSRLFERQADAFASRPADDEPPTRERAAVFASALRHVARVNNLPMDAHSMTAGRPFVGRMIGWLMHHAATWLHGSIRSRIDHVARLADEPARAGRFDRTMALIRLLLLCALIGAAVTYVRDRRAEKELPADQSWNKNSTSTDAFKGSEFTPTAARA
ncbi:MAG: M48 family metallopeptidase [Tepidisphaeraceae bacterium]